jgi:photosystem II stability/assembly factor-like uncharacterized protein
VLSKFQKNLTIFLLFALAACTPVKTQRPNQPASPQSPNLVYPPNTSYPESRQPSTFTASDEPAQPSTNTPAPTLSPSSSQIVSSTLQTLPSPRIAQLKMFDAKTGWAVQTVPYVASMDNRILRTVNGLRTWINVSPPVHEGSYIFLTASFIDANTAVVVYNRQLLPTSDAVEVTTWRTNDGGQTWQVGETIPTHLGVMEGIEVMMLDPDHGWMLGIGTPAMGNANVRFSETQDGGMHWKVVYDTSDHLTDPNALWVGGYYPYVTHFIFVSEAVGFFSDGRLFSSQDEGSSLISHPLDPPIDFPDIDCTGSDCKYRDTISAPHFTSPKAGALLRRIYLNSEEVINSFAFGDPLTQLPLAQYLYFTHDGGQTWVPKPSPVKIGTVYFWNAQTGWLLGKNDPDPATTTQFYQTTDGGETWKQVLADCPLPLGSELQFVDDQIGYAFYPSTVLDYYKNFDERVNQAPLLFSTHDGGRSWVKVEPQIAP